VVKLLIKLDVRGRENYPAQGPMLMVSNHLGDADLVVGLALAPRPFDLMGKIELYDFPVVGWLMQIYGTIWVHRGTPDRRAIRAVLQGLSEGRLVAMAPEGRQSLTTELEEGTGGAAFLALKAGVPVLPVAFAGTENKNVYASLKRFRRAIVSVNVGEPIYVQTGENRRQAVQYGTERIMRALANLLPVEYQGIYRNTLE
jgi:1-acyl-sn-glycerol-3-phosphate acyltransferase